MNQGKLKVVKHEMEGVNVDILRISKLKWTGMSEFNSHGSSLVTRAAVPLNTHSCPHYLSSSINTELGELSPASPHFSSPVMLPSSGTVLFMGQVMEP